MIHNHVEVVSAKTRAIMKEKNFRQHPTVETEEDLLRVRSSMCFVGYPVQITFLLSISRLT